MSARAGEAISPPPGAAGRGRRAGIRRQARERVRLALGLCAHAYGTYFMGETDPWFDRMRARFRLEHGLLLGGAFMFAGVVLGGIILATWIAHGFGSLADERLAVVAASVLIVGMQIFFSSFLLSILGLRRR